MSRLTAHLRVPTVYTSLAKSAMRAYPNKILKESNNACDAATQLFRMPLPSNDYEGDTHPRRRRLIGAPCPRATAFAGSTTHDHRQLTLSARPTAKQELGYRMDMALAALKFFNTQYS
jgi:hypothetical protein